MKVEHITIVVGESDQGMKAKGKAGVAVHPSSYSNDSSKSPFLDCHLLFCHLSFTGFDQKAIFSNRDTRLPSRSSECLKY